MAIASRVFSDAGVEVSFLRNVYAIHPCMPHNADEFKNILSYDFKIPYPPPGTSILFNKLLSKFLGGGSKLS